MKAGHLAALGALLISVTAQISSWPDWSPIYTPAGAGGIGAAIGATLIALFSDKPRAADAQTRSGDR